MPAAPEVRMLLAAFTALGAAAAPAGPRWERLAPMERPRTGHTLTALADGSLLAIGGAPSDEDGAAPVASGERYDPVANQWRAAGSMKLPRTGHASVLLDDGRVLVLGGKISAGDYDTVRAEITATTEVFDPRTGTFAPGPAMITPRALHRALRAPSGEVWVVGGKGPHPAGAASGTVEIFDPKTNAFHAGPALDGPQPYPAAALAGAQLVLLDAQRRSKRIGPRWFQVKESKPLRGALQLIDTGTGAVARLEAPPRALSGGDLAVAGSQVFLLGECVDRAPAACAWLFDPVGRGFHDAPSPPAGARAWLTAAPDGSLLALSEKAAARFSQGKWTALPAPAVSHGGFPAAALADGSVVYAGGAGAALVPNVSRLVLGRR